MIPHSPSLRRRLPLSYAAIALLATLSLGAVLFLILRSFYQQQELDYLTNNAQAISRTVQPLLETQAPPQALRSQLTNYAFLSQTQVRILDPAGNPLADSGPPPEQQAVLALSVEAHVEIGHDGTNEVITETVTFADQDQNYTAFFVIQNDERNVEIERFNGLWPDIDFLTEEEEVIIEESITMTTTDQATLPPLLWREAGEERLPYAAFIRTAGTPYGFEFTGDPIADGPRSNQVVSQPIYDRAGQRLGTIELSNGPAYGRQVLQSVVWGWAIASGVATLLATGVGWVISRRISQPLLTLTAITGRMAEGNLAIRADVTRRDELGTLAKAFNEMADQVEETVTTLRRFVADAAHELHTPLTALRTNLELAATEDDPRLFFNQAQQQVARLERLTGSLLDLSRLETAPNEADFSDVEMVALLRDESERYAAQAEQAHLDYALDLPQTPLIVRGNAEQLRRVWDNLFENAVKFTAAEGAVRLGLRSLPAEGRVEGWVEDNGLGLAAEDLPHLFSRFYRGRNAVAYPGSGLGLAIVKAIIERHGGQVWAEPRTRGTRVVFWLPLSGKALFSNGYRSNVT